jgi:hypothetical protein
MGQMSIKSHSSTVGTNAQTIVVPSQTSEVNSVQSTQPKNPQQPGGKKKRNKKKKIPIMRKGLPLPKTPRREALRKKEELFPCMICGEDHPTHQFLGRMRSIYFWHNNGPPIAYCLNPSFPPSTSKYGFHKSFPSARGHGRYPSP